MSEKTVEIISDSLQILIFIKTFSKYYLILIFIEEMRKNTISSFIEKTWDILQDTQYSSIVRWTEDGNSFLILSEERLCSDVLPKYFKHSNFSSFIRQVKLVFYVVEYV